MYQTDEILNRLNAAGKVKNTLKAGECQITLPDIMVRSFAEAKELAGDTLTWGEKNFLYQQAQAELKENRMAESRILSRANPQLANAVRLGIRQSSMLRSYDDLFPARASSFVKPGSVASMFSPAGYLTELYREARDLHPSTSQYNLDTRRPDLASLSLSQDNMDDELSTLSLSNDLCLNNIQSQESKDYNGVMEMLSTYRQTGGTPYHQPYEATRQAILLQDPEFTAFRNNPAVAAKMDTASLLSIQTDISPELYEILTEEITEDTTDELFKKNFGDIDASLFQNIAYLSQYYNITHAEAAAFLGVMGGNNFWVGDEIDSFYSKDSGEIVAYKIKRIRGDNYDELEYFDLYCRGNNSYFVKVKFKNDYGMASLKLKNPESDESDVYITSLGVAGETKSGIVYQSSDFTLTDDITSRIFELYLYRYGTEDTDKKISSGAWFSFESSESYQITKEKGENYDEQLYFMDLYYEGDNKFFVTAKFKESYGKVSVRTVEPPAFLISLNGDKPTDADVVYKSGTFKLDDALLSNYFELSFYRYGPDEVNDPKTSCTAHFRFNSNDMSSAMVFNPEFLTPLLLLKLNKLIRLYKASGVVTSDIRAVIESNNYDLNISTQVLTRFFWVKFYMRRYSIDAAAALVLFGELISQSPRGSQSSVFSLLFNTPPLNNQVFSADGTTIKLEPAGVTDTFRTGVIKRAFGVNDTELYTLWSLATGNASPPDFTCDINNLSILYRVSLLAETHGLNVTELAALLSVSPYATQAIESLSDSDMARLISFVDQYTQWLSQMNWTVSDLYLMTTKRFSTMMSPDIENLITTLKNGLLNQKFSDGAGEAEYIIAAAPFIAAATQLDSAEMAVAILQWLGQLKPQGLTVTAFLTLVAKEKLTGAETVQLVSFCQVLGQLSLFARKASLNAAELSWVVDHPAIMTDEATVLEHDIAMLRDLTLLHAVLARCGGSATQVITSLSGKTGSETNNLPVETVATAMNLDEQALTQALAQCSGYAYFYSWIHLRDALQWLNAANTLGISPAALGSLLNLMYTDPNKRPSYADWEAASHILQAGLSTRQRVQQQQVLDEALSVAATAYVIKTIAPSWVTDRDKLYGWLLIDNQVSAQIKTTRIAEGIASVQLYVNRALSGQEEGVVSAVKSKTFFSSDWDTYNKRYSTWAGVSQLVYYPENYVDPTLRIGQTGMMDEMLQSLSQSQLTSDTVEATFKTYMTRFEEIANLDVISGYHDAVSDKSGKTYLIGRSAIGDYYWRSADVDKMSDGKLPANAWSEWKKITAGIAPVANLVRPVIFQSRLYVVWAESREVATTGSTPTKSVEYLLKYAHILHDGTWSAPVTITPAQDTLPPKGAAIADTGMYCARDAGLDKIYIYFYKKADSYSTLPANIAGLSLYPDGTTENIPADSAALMTGYIYLQLDTIAAVRLNTPYTGGSTRISISGTTSDGGGWGDLYYTYVTGGKLSDLTAEVSDNNVVINFNATARVIYSGNAGSRSHTQIEMMKSIGSMGNVFYLPQDVSRSSIAIASGRNFECVSMFSSEDHYDSAILVTDSISPVSGDKIYCFNNPSTNLLNSKSHMGTYWADFTQDVNNNKLWRRSASALSPENYLYAAMSPLTGSAYTNNELMFGGFLKIDTKINPSDVKISISGGGDFTSDTRTKFTFDESLFSFNNKTASAPMSLFSGNTAKIAFTMSVDAPSGDARSSLGSEIFNITLIRVDESSMPVITLNRTDTYAQYLQYGVYRIRVNTLFAKQLVARADAGLDTVLSMESQQLQEPKLWKGFYVDFGLPAYNSTIHGSSRNFTLNLKHVVDNNTHVLYSGMLTDSEMSVKLFVPLDEKPLNSDYCARVFLKTNNTGDDSWKGAHFKYTDSSQAAIEINTNSDISMFTSITILPDSTEPMDFGGANALYFWEMFYYVPMMVFKRLLSEGKFTEATQWIKYVWSPDGYLINGEPAPYQWNVRPLEEETTWHATPLDSVDPDAVAQADPMHYKVATFMAWLDLLIARGDAAYRQLERDTLNEAKMWYVQALDLLGDEPYLTQASAWASPRLTDAADNTTTKSVQQALLGVRQQVASGELRTANSLTDLFLPQQNEKLAGYWQTLAQRLYNLRHNLSIDGSPLSLSIYAAPADPAALLSAAVNTSSGGADLPAAVMPLYRFPVILESARGMVSQLTQFGSTLLSITERQDAEALSELLQTQGSELMLQSIALQNSVISETDADKTALEAARSGAQSRLDSYTTLYDEDINTGEKQAMDLYLSSSVISTAASALHMAGAALEMVPNIYGMAVGGSRYGALLNAGAIGMQISGDATRIAADRISQSEAYRRRRQEWEIQRNNAQADVNQIDAQLAALAVRREGAVLQKTYLETQQAQMQAQMTFLQNKFTSKALYNWLRGKLAAIYYQFYDLAVSRCLMAEEAYQWALGTESAFIRPGAWQGTYAGLMAGETLMLNLAQMEQDYLNKDQRQKEVTRTVCLSEVYAGLTDQDSKGNSLSFNLADQVVALVTTGSGSSGTDDNGLSVTSDKQLQATLKLSDLNIQSDYPASLGNLRRLKQISVTLPALVGPYQDVRAVLSYGGSVKMPQGCTAMAVSHGMNDGGQFQLDFNDARWLPFEGIPVSDNGTLTLSFPDADDRQKDLLLSLTDIILHIRYTIVS